MVPKERLKEALGVEVSYDNDNWLHILATRDFCRYRRSASGAFEVAWCDGHYRDGLAVNGRYYLLEHGRVRVWGTLERPDEARVADSGHFIVVDQLFSNTPGGIVYVFDRDGTELSARKTSCNAGTPAISADGSVAGCYLPSSPEREAHRVCVVWDTRSGNTLGEIGLPEASPTELSIDASARLIAVQYREWGPYQFRFSGEPLDAARFEQEHLSWVHIARLVWGARDLVERSKREPDASSARRILELLDHAVRRGALLEASYAPVIYQCRGLARAALGDAPEAIADLERVLALNPKLTVKRKLAALKKAAS